MEQEISNAEHSFAVTIVKAETIIANLLVMFLTNFALFSKTIE